MSPPQRGAERRMPAMGDGKKVGQEAVSLTYACFSFSTHDGANLCRPGKQRGGGEAKVSVAIQTADTTVTSSVEERQ